MLPKETRVAVLSGRRPTPVVARRRDGNLAGYWTKSGQPIELLTQSSRKQVKESLFIRSIEQYPGDAPFRKYVRFVIIQATHRLTLSTTRS